MIKYELIPEQLLHEGIAGPENFFEPEPVDIHTITLAHEQQYSERFIAVDLEPAMIRRIGFPLSPELVERELRIVQGTIDGARYAMKHGVAFNAAGGTHHAGSYWGEGFCMLNDQAIAAAYLVDRKLVKQVLIVDLDVHQGNGTSEIFQNEPRVFTFSMHAEHNYPFRKEKSDLDIGLQEGVGDDEYLELLNNTLLRLLTTVSPDFVFYQAGVDVLATDKLGKLKLTQAACRERDELVFMHCKASGIPVQVSMGGGYSVHIRDIVDAHCNTYKAAVQIFD